MSILTVKRNDKVIQIEFFSRSLLRDLLISHGIELAFPCGGNGKCGKCTALVDGEEKQLCRTFVQGDTTLVLPEELLFETAEGAGAGAAGKLSDMRASSAGRRLGAAVDLGTTTIEAKIIDLDTGDCMNYGAVKNPQSRYGADVISRISASLSRKGKELQILSQNAIYNLVYRLLGRPSEVLPRVLESMVVTGNTAMLYLLTGRSPESLSHAPFESDFYFGEETRLFGIPTYLPPCMHAFAGADLTGAVLKSGMTERGETALLADFGTNGEIALWHQGCLYVTSTAAGPAFERADAPGSEIVDALAYFLKTGQVDSTGMIVNMEDKLTCMGRQGKVRLTIDDIRAVQLAKSAVTSGIQVLLKEAGCPAGSVRRFYIAGNFGTFLNLENACRIGMVPAALASKAESLGNAALGGAIEMLMSDANKRKAEALRNKAVHIELGGNQTFSDLFIHSMGFEIPVE